MFDRSRLNTLHASFALLLAIVWLGSARPVTAGSISDPASDDAIAARALKISRLNTGTDVDLTLIDGQHVRGVYQGLGRMPDEEYRRRFESIAAQFPDTLALPAPGSTVGVQVGGGKPYGARLVAFGFRSAELSRSPDDRKAKAVPFEQIVALRDAKGHLWTGAALMAEAHRGRIAANTQLLLGSGGSSQSVPLDRVKEVSYRTKDGQWVAGGILAFAFAGVAMVAWAATAMSGLGLGR